MVTGEFLKGRKMHPGRCDGLTPWSGRGKSEFIKFFNLSTRAPSRGHVGGMSSLFPHLYEVLNILNYLELYIRDQWVSPIQDGWGISIDLEEFAHHAGGRGGMAPISLRIASDSAAIGPAAPPPLHVHTWRTT